MTTLYDHIYRLNVYLNEALPKARAEGKRGRLRLNCYATSCGTMGCVAYHYADAMGELSSLKQHPEDLEDSIANFVSCHYCSFGGTRAFAGWHYPLSQREANVRARLAEYESELELRND